MIRFAVTLLLIFVSTFLHAQDLTTDSIKPGTIENPQLIDTVVVMGYSGRRRLETSGDGEIVVKGKLSITSFYAYSQKTKELLSLKARIYPLQTLETETIVRETEDYKSYYTQLKSSRNLKSLLKQSFHFNALGGYQNKNDESFSHITSGLSFSKQPTERHSIGVDLQVGYYWINSKLENKNAPTFGTSLSYIFQANYRLDLSTTLFGYGYNTAIEEIKQISMYRSNFWTTYGGQYWRHKFHFWMHAGYMWQNNREQNYRSPLAAGGVNYDITAKKFSWKWSLSLVAKGSYRKDNSYFLLGINLSKVQRTYAGSGTIRKNKR